MKGLLTPFFTRITFSSNPLYPYDLSPTLVLNDFLKSLKVFKLHGCLIQYRFLPLLYLLQGIVGQRLRITSNCISRLVYCSLVWIRILGVIVIAIAVELKQTLVYVFQSKWPLVNLKILFILEYSCPLFSLWIRPWCESWRQQLLFLFYPYADIAPVMLRANGCGVFGSEFE